MAVIFEILEDGRCFVELWPNPPYTKRNVLEKWFADNHIEMMDILLRGGKKNPVTGQMQIRLGFYVKSVEDAVAIKMKHH